jgi:Putative lumazine-binding
MLSERDGIERVVADYYESWFTGDAERMRASLHPNLAKRAIEHAGDGSLDLELTSADEMVAATAEGHGMRYPHGHDAQVLDIDGDLASVKVVSAPYVEYLHLGRFGKRWLIVNILWRYRANGAPAR